MSEQYRIIELRAENIKRLEAVTITPKGNVVIVGGMNAQGKSSVLDAIEMALRGKSAPLEPIRRGANRGEVNLDLGGLKVERSFTPGGKTGRLVVTDAEGKSLASPQAVLDKLVGSVSFDPLEFSRLKPREQVDRLRELVGLGPDFDALDAERLELYDERTGVGRQVKALEGQLQDFPVDPTAPDAEVSIGELAGELQRRVRHNEANNAQRDELRGLEADAAKIVATRDGVLERIAEREAELERMRAEAGRLAVDVRTANVASGRQRAIVDGLVDVDVDEVRRQIEAAEGLNNRFRSAQRRREKDAEVDGLKADQDVLTKQIEGIDAKKRGMMAAAPFPIKGLGFDEHGVTYAGIPFAQASSAERLRVSVAMGLGLNPQLPVLLIREGSLLDEGNLAMIADMAAAANAQVWIERVGVDAPAAVVIQDGMVVDPAAGRPLRMEGAGDEAKANAGPGSSGEAGDERPY